MKHLIFILALLWCASALAQPVNRIKLRQLQAAPDTTSNYRIISSKDTSRWVLVGVNEITNVPDTSSLTPVIGNIFVNAAKDTLGIYSTYWILFSGGGGAGDNLGNHTATTNLNMDGNTILGGTGTTSDLILQTTSGVGATGADMFFLVGNNGGTEAMKILNNGNIGMGGATTPAQTLHVQGTARITGSDGTPTGIMGRDADGDVGAVTLGTGLTLSGGELSATGGGHIIADEGTALTARDTLDFQGAGVTVTDGTTKTIVTISGAGTATLPTVTNATGGENVYQESGTATSNEILDYINAERIPIEQNWKISDTVTTPSGFTLSVPFSIWRKGDGTYGTQYDDIDVWRDSFLHTVTGTYYVDRIGGSNFNAGTSFSAPYETYAFAISRTSPGVKTIYLKPGIYDTNGDFSTVYDTLQIICPEGIAHLVNVKDGLSWSATTITGVYKATTTDTNIIVANPFEYGELGQFKFLTEVADTSAMQNYPSTYCYVADTLYIHTPDGATPTSLSNIILGVSSAGTIQEPQAYFENIYLYGSTGFSQATGKLKMRNCGIFYNPGAADLLALTGPTYLYGLKFGYSYNDAVDWKTNGDGFEINCIGRNAGSDNTAADNQLSTLHGGSRVVTINPDYRGASNQAIFDVNTNTQRWVLGGTVGDTYNKENTSTSAIGVGNNAADFATMWIEGTKLGGNVDYEYSANYGTIYVRNVTINATTRANLTNGGTIEKY